MSSIHLFKSFQQVNEPHPQENKVSSTASEKNFNIRKLKMKN